MQGVALTGRNDTGPTLSVADDDRRQRASIVCPPTLCVGGPVKWRNLIYCMQTLQRVSHDYMARQSIAHINCGIKCNLQLFIY